MLNMYENSAESFWIQCKQQTDRPSLSGKLSFRQTDSELSSNNLAEKRFSIERVASNKKSVEIRCGNLLRKFVAPVLKFSPHFTEAEKTQNNNRKPQSVLNLDVTNAGLGVSCSKNGGLLVWLTENGQIRRTLSGHVEDVCVCKFFPSGVVVLSGGSDFKLKVWSCEDASNPVSILAHAYGVSDFCIVDRGRNVVSTGRDGLCKLIDVGESTTLATIAQLNTLINSCCIQSLNNDLVQALNISPRNEPQSEREIGTENKIIALACEDNFLRVFALRSREQIAEYDCESSVNCCCFLSEIQVACGTQNGCIFVFNLLAEKSSITSWQEFRSSILSMSSFKGSNNGLLISTGDGSCVVWNYSDEKPVIDLTGPDCDPVYKAVANETHIFTCCRDGYIRKYALSDL